MRHMSSWAKWWIICGAFAPDGHHAGGLGRRHAGIHRLPCVALAAIVDQQPAGASEPGSTPARTRVADNFSNPPEARRPAGAMLIEQYDDWTEGRRYVTIPTPGQRGSSPIKHLAGH